MSKRNENDFFNLESSGESEEEAETGAEAQASKWDWDRAENFHLYYKTHWEAAAKRSCDDERPPGPSKRLAKDEEVRGSRVEVGEDSSGCLAKLVGHRSSVNRVHWTKTTPDLLLSSSMDGTIMLWDLSRKTKGLERQSVRSLADVHSKSVRNAIWSSDESQIYSVSFDQSCAVTDVETGKVVSRFEHSSILTAVQCNEQLVLVGAKNEILEWDTRSAKPAKTFKSHVGQVQDLVFLPGESEFISAGDNVSKESAQFSIVVWDLKTTAVLSNQIFHEKFICTCLKRHPMHALFYAQTHGDYIAEFSARKPFKMNKHKRFDKHQVQGYAVGMDVSANGRQLASGSADGCVYLYESETGKLARKLDAFNKELVRQPCMDAKFEPGASPQRLAASCWNGLIKILQL